MGKLYDEIMEIVRFHAVEIPVVYGDGEKSTAKYVPLEEVGMALAILEDRTNAELIDILFSITFGFSKSEDMKQEIAIYEDRQYLAQITQRDNKVSDWLNKPYGEE